LIVRRVVLRSVRRLYSWARVDPVEEDLRGWSWDRPPVKPRAYLGLGVSEVAGKYCPARRDVWLRRKMGLTPEATEPLLLGRALHEAVAQAIRCVSRGLVKGWDTWDILGYCLNKFKPTEAGLDLQVAARAYRSALTTILGEIEFEKLSNGGSSFPLVSEMKVDGTPVGLSAQLSIDVYAENIVIDFKTGSPRDFHKLSIAGYALALESEYEVPVDYGLLVYVNQVNGDLRVQYKPVYVSNDLRRWFLEERDDIIDMLLSEREPPADKNCPQTCPFYKVCHR